DPRPLVDDGPGGDAYAVPDLHVLADQGSDLRDGVPLPVDLHVSRPGRGQEAGPGDDPGPKDPVLHDARGTQDHVVHEDRVRDARVRPDPDVLPEARRRQEDRVRPDLTAGPEGERTLEVRAGPDHTAVPDRDAAADRDGRLDRPRPDLARALEGRRVQPEE